MMNYDRVLVAIFRLCDAPVYAEVAAWSSEHHWCVCGFGVAHLKREAAIYQAMSGAGRVSIEIAASAGGSHTDGGTAMDKEDLEKLRRELESLVNEVRGSSRGPHSTELEYHLSRLTTALSGFTQFAYRSMHLHHQRAELLAQIDALLAQTDEIHELARRVREVLLRPPPEEKPADPPGFTE